MADPEHSRQNRHTRDTKNLNYGHFGTATYEDSTHSWHFLRQIHSYHQRDDRNSGLNSFQLIHESIQHHGWHAPELNNSSRKAPDWPAAGRALLKRTPEIFGAVPYLQTPSEPDNLEMPCLPQTPTELLAFGHARAIGDRGSHSRLVPIAAVPAGVGGEIVQFIGIDPGSTVPQDDSAQPSAWRVPCISGSRTGYWCQSAERILQISYCTSHHRTQLLVRKMGGTSILRPIITPRMASVATLSRVGSTKAKPSASSIDPNHILTIPCSRTGGHHHADAMFKPQDPNMLAIIDINGQWSLWKIKGNQNQSTRVTLRAKLLQQGSLLDTEPQPFPFNQNIDLVGWLRMCWLSNSTGIAERIFICTRFSASIFNTQGDFVGHVDMRLSPSSDDICILDVKQSERNRQLIYVLSTSHLQIFTTSQSDSDLGARTGPLNLLCSWKHFRDECDLGLRMAVVEFSHGTCVFLSSPLSTMVTVFQFRHSQSSSRIECSWEPSSFQWPKSLCERAKSITNLVIVPANSPVNNHQPDKLELGVVKLVAWTSQGDTIEAFYRQGQENISATTEEAAGNFLLAPLSSTSQPYLSSRFVDEDDLDNFMVEDDTEGEGEWTAYNDSKPALQKEVQILSHRAASLQWDNILDERALQSDEKSRPGVAESLDRLYPRGTRLWDGSSPISTLSYLLRAPRILDLETASQSVDKWINTIQATGHVFIQPVNSHTKSLLYEIRHTNLLTLYNTFLFAYIAPLSPLVTDRIRVNREKIVRQAAADAFFGGMALRSKDHASETEDIHQASAKEVDSSDLQLYSSQPPMATSQPLAQEPIVSRLCSYTTFKRENPPILSTSSIPISNILEHLPNTINSDPKTYSYEATNKKIQNAQDEEAELLLNTRERRKFRRQSTKRLKALEKQTKYSQEVQLGRSMPPSVTNRRLAPTLPGREVRSSQPGAPESSQSQGQGTSMHNMSQPERGAYGTRPPMKRKGKQKMVVKRKAGF